MNINSWSESAQSLSAAKRAVRMRGVVVDGLINSNRCYEGAMGEGSLQKTSLIFYLFTLVHISSERKGKETQ